MGFSMEKLSYGWGVDGFDRPHLHKKGSLLVVFCGLHGGAGKGLAMYYQDMRFAMNLTKGSAYKLGRYGFVEYVGIDVYFGQTTFQFNNGERDIYILPEELEMLMPKSNKQEEI